MRTDRTLADAEQQWIAKYRAALQIVPVQKPRFGGLLTLIHSAKNAIVSRFGKVMVNLPSDRRILKSEFPLTASIAGSDSKPVVERLPLQPESTPRRPRPVEKSGRKRRLAKAN